MPANNKILNQQEDKKEDGDEYAGKDLPGKNPEDKSEKSVVNLSSSTSEKDNVSNSDKLIGDDLEITKAEKNSEPEDDTIRNNK